MKRLMFLLIEFLLIAVSYNPYFRTGFGSKSLGKLIEYVFGVESMRVWEGLEMKNEEESWKTFWEDVGAPRLYRP